MARNIFIGVNGAAKKVGSLYVGMTDEAKKVRRVFVGVNGQAEMCYPDIMELKFGGTSTSYRSAINNGALFHFSGVDLTQWSTSLQMEFIDLNTTISNPLIMDLRDSSGGFVKFYTTPTEFKKYCKFTSSDSSVLSVNQATGSLTPVSAGTANITLECEGRSLVIPFRVVDTTYTPVSGFHFVHGYRYENGRFISAEYEFTSHKMSNTYLSFSSNDWSGTWQEWQALSNEEQDAYRNSALMTVQPGDIYKITIPKFSDTLSSSISRLKVTDNGFQGISGNISQVAIDGLVPCGGHEKTNITKDYAYCTFIRIPSGVNKITMVIDTPMSGSYAGDISTDVCTWLTNNVTIEKVTY